jgi:N6-adenosine-specific RNA methylase IME4
VTNSITLDERSRLYQLEETIRQGLNTFVDVGNALLEIRDKRLYRQEYSTFEEYCNKQWNFTKQRVYQLMDSASVMDTLQKSTTVDFFPTSERQARPLASLETDEQVEVWQQIVEDSLENNITANVVLNAVKNYSQKKRDERRQERIENITEIVANNKPVDGIGVFPVIYADPPWQYDHPISDSRKIENQYPTMPIEEIYALPVEKISAPDCILFLWVTTPFLEKGLRVLGAWGFDYRTSMVWVKPSIGPGQWVRQRHEYLLIGVRGNIPTPEGKNKPDSVIEAPREEHSKKPEVVYNIIESMYPELPKVELFCRNPREGWVAWGNEA